jgi:multiple sugar transport system substrate-binding protein
MKKIQSVIGILIIMSAAVFAAGKSKTAQSAAVDMNQDGTVNNPEAVSLDRNKLVFWSLFSGGDGSFMDKILSSYNATNPPKQVQSIMLVWADYYTKLMTAVSAKKGPDIGVSHISKLPELVAQGAVVPIDKYAKKAGVDWSKYTPEMNAGVTFNGKHYAMPLDTHAEILYFNKDWLSKAGIQLNSSGQLTVNSTAEFTAVLDKLKKVAGDGQSPLALTQTGDDPYRVWWATYFQMGGTPLVNAEGDKVTLDTAVAVKAADYLKSLWSSGYILKGIVDHQKLFQGGNAGLVFGGTWATGAFEQTQDLHFGAQAFPSLFNNSEACWADAHTFIIPVKKGRSEADTQAAVNFIYWASTKGATTWAGSGQIPSNLDVQKSAAYKALPYRSSYMRAASTAVLPSKNEHFYSMKDAMIRNLDTIWTGQVSTEQGIKTLKSELEEAIM